MITVILGTVTSVIAFIQLMTLPGMPRISPSSPMRNPGTSTRYTSGMLNESHSTMKLVTFWHASASSAPPLKKGLFAMKPTVLPSRRASTVAMDLPKRSLSTNVVDLVPRLGNDLEHSPAGFVGALGHRMLGRRLHVVARQIREEFPDRIE